MTLLYAVVFVFTTASANAKSQLTMKAQEPTLAQVIETVKSQSPYQFFYDSQLADMKLNPVDVSDADLSALLDQAFAGKGIVYKIKDNICYLSVEQPADTPADNQQRTVSGQVKDNAGNPLTGVSVRLEGTKAGTISGTDGRYSFTVPAGDQELAFSHIGYTTVKEKVGTRTVVNVTLPESSLDVEEVVVTAFGIKRDVKSLTYNVQTLDMGDIAAAKDANMMSNLAGKLAGVRIQQSSSGVGGSTRVVMRGTKSLFGNNNALYVLDGIPLLTGKSAQSDNYYEVGEEGDNEVIAMINPDDIESMSVLTGIAATALYGNRGASGVVLLTTKRGSGDKTTVRYSNNTTFSTPFVLPKFQNTYGRQGENYASWGDKLETPSSYRPRDFFETGVNGMNSVSLQTGNEQHNLYTSIASTNAKGMIPNRTYDRYNFTIRTSSQLIKSKPDKLTFDFTANYIEQRDKNSIGQGLYYNPLVPVYLFPPGDDMNRFVPYEIWNSERNFKTQNWAYESEGLEGLKQNPFWIANRNVFKNKRERTILTGSLSWKITDWVSLAGRLRMDKAEGLYERRLFASTNALFAKSEAGNFSRYRQHSKNMYLDFMFNIDKSFARDFRIIANLGASMNDERDSYEGYDGPLATVPNFFHIGNIKDLEHKRDRKRTERVNSMFGTAQLGYRNFAYLDLTTRYDFFSSMRGFKKEYEIYPSVGLSTIISELLPQSSRSVLSFWKLRGSYSEVGNQMVPYRSEEYVAMENGSIINDVTYVHPNLKPEKTKSVEVGTNIRLWKNKVNLDVTYYNSNTYNQLFTYELPPSTSYRNTYVNGGKVNNYGVELTLNVNQNIGPVDWNFGVVWSLNRNKIKELLPEYFTDPYSGVQTKSPEEVIVSGAGGYRMILQKGGTMGDIFVTSFKRDHNGYIFVNPTSGVFSIDQNNFFKIGSADPKYNLGVSNNFYWNGISFGFFVDARVGGVVVSATQALMDRYGVSEATAIARENGGVPVNMGLMDAKTYYEIIGAGNTGEAMSEYTYSATNVRLREVSVGYDLPSKWFNDKVNVSVSLFGRNLYMFYNKAPFDPELTSNTGTYYQGYDYFMPPSQKQLGFGVNVTF